MDDNLDKFDDLVAMQKQLFRQQLGVYYMLRKALEEKNMGLALGITENMIQAARECLKS